MSTQNQSCKILFLCLLFPMLLLVGCGIPKPTQAKQKPGIVMTGWNNASMNLNRVFAGIDIEGKVGYRLEVSAPTAYCVPPNPGGGWSAKTRVISGQLPPGLGFQDGDWIKGIPTKRGNYIVVLELYDIKCYDTNNTNFGSWKQELRFHIGGVGIVND